MELTIPDGVMEAAALNDALDSVLSGGLARVSDEQLEALHELSQAILGTPLGQAASEAVRAIADGDLLVRHVAVLAACREALEGARADALIDVAAASIGLQVETPEERPSVPYSDAAEALMPGLQQWLMELALAGMETAETDTIASAMTLLPKVQELDELARLGTLLTLWVDEMVSWDRSEDIPTRRWSDLWCRAMLLTMASPPQVTEETVSGGLRLLGSEILHGPHAVQFVLHGVFTDDTRARVVRVPISHWKVDALTGVEVLHILYQRSPELLSAIAQPVELTVKEMVLRSSGELLWRGTVTKTRALKVKELSFSGASWTRPPPRDRHPVQVALPVVVEGSLSDGHLLGLRANMGRISPWLNEHVPAMENADRIFALLCFDEGWELQPINGTAKKKWLTPVKEVAKAMNLKAPASAILQERASRLLRI